MSWDGMYPKHNCKECGKELNADGGHPAELYAGTYTGLCYGCQNAPVKKLSRYTLDGAVIMDYAPHCPSWRRDREQFTAFEDCEDCKGSGRKYKSVSHFNSYYAQCEPCFKRFYGHPERKKYQEREKKNGPHIRKLMESWSLRYSEAARLAGVDPDSFSPEATALRVEYRAKFDAEVKEQGLAYEQLREEFAHIFATENLLK